MDFSDNDNVTNNFTTNENFALSQDGAQVTTSTSRKTRNNNNNNNIENDNGDDSAARITRSLFSSQPVQHDQSNSNSKALRTACQKLLNDFLIVTNPSQIENNNRRRNNN